MTSCCSSIKSSLNQGCESLQIFTLNQYVKFDDWTSVNVVNVKGRFDLKDTDGTLKTIAKIFARLCTVLALSPFAALGMTYSWVKENICGQVKKPPNPTKPLHAEDINT